MSMRAWPRPRRPGWHWPSGPRDEPRRGYARPHRADRAHRLRQVDRRPDARTLGAVVIDADALAREVTAAPALRAHSRPLRSAGVEPDGALNRAALAASSSPTRAPSPDPRGHRPPGRSAALVAAARPPAETHRSSSSRPSSSSRATWPSMRRGLARHLRRCVTGEPTGRSRGDSGRCGASHGGPGRHPRAPGDRCDAGPRDRRRARQRPGRCAGRVRGGARPGAYLDRTGVLFPVFDARIASCPTSSSSPPSSPPVTSRAPSSASRRGSPAA